ncbi:MAG: hypothetical protein ACI86H_000274 [bacterium]|jgi:hypothetical protein
MIKHVVFFKLKEKNNENINKLTTALKSLKAEINELVDVEVGEDFVGSERSMDIILITSFTTKEDFKIYGTHPHHLPVLSLAKELCSEVKAVDYEI